MTHGKGSILVLSPKGGTAITFNMSGGAADVVEYTFVVDAGRLDFNEEARWQWAYDQNSTGGRVTGAQTGLVPVTFSVIIRATSADYRKAAYAALQAALMNRRGGTLKYRPEEAEAGTLDTYYHYVASKPPRLLDATGNRWDSAAGSKGLYTLQVDVELMTQAIATSDPDTPVTVASLGATIDNWVDASPSQTNRITVDGDDLEGSLPALVRLLVTPASSQRLGRVIVFRRSDADGTLANVKTVYEAEDATSVPPTSAWSEVADASRGDGAYMRCFPNSDANAVSHGLKFTLTNPNDVKGRFAVFGIGYDDGVTPGLWTHQVKVYSGNASQTGQADYYAASTQAWQAIFAGEFELPLTDLSDLTAGYDVGPYLEWYSTRASGESEFRLDAIMIVWVSDLLGPYGDGTALDVVCDDADDGAVVGGVESPDKLLIENLPGLAGITTGRAYVVASDNDIARVLRTAPRGDFLELEPGHDHLLVFLQERASGTLVNETFTNYKASSWFYVARMEDDENWTGYSSNIDDENYVEGNFALRFHVTSDIPVYRDYLPYDKDMSIDGRFDDGDFVCLRMYFDDTTDFYSLLIFLFAPTYIDSFSYELLIDGNGSISNGWNYIYIKKSSFAAGGSADWSDVIMLELEPMPIKAYAVHCWMDYWTIEKADPDDADVPNATGDVWNFQPDAGVWTITEDVTEDTPGATLACLDVESGVEKVALLDKIIPSDVRLRARVYAKRDTGTVGVLWRAGDDCLTEGAEAGYALMLNTGGDTLSVLEYTTGTPTTLYSTGVTMEADRWYTLGIQAKGSAHRVYEALSSGLDYDDSEIFGDSHLKKSFTDATYASGKVGLMSQSTLGRFDDVVLESIEDKVVPADQITVSGQAVFRTIAPFS